MLIIQRSIDKESLNGLPKVTFPGEIHVVQTPWEAERAVTYLKHSDEKHCFLFRLNLTGLTLPIITLLESPHTTKVGLSLKDDFMMLHKRAPFEQRSCIELQEYVRAFGIEDKSLQKIYGILFGEKISKSQRLTNWEADTLTEPQKLYAATDAWACLNIYNRLQELKRTGDFEIAAKEESNPNAQ